MRYTIKTEAGHVTVEACAGRVVVNGQALLPFEADIFGQALSRLGQALTEAAEHAETLAARKSVLAAELRRAAEAV